MSGLDPIEMFRQEAGELLDSLESTLLDLGQDPQRKDLVDTAFRALHTIKGSGAMFGFDQVAAFTHDFETAFDLVRQGKASASQDLIAVALAAKDHIRALIEAPDDASGVIGQAILGNLKSLVALTADQDGPAKPKVAAEHSPRSTGWHLAIAYHQSVLRNGTDPLALLDELRALGTCSFSASSESVPDLEALDPQDLYLRWSGTLVGDCSRDDIDNVFMFVLDDMVLDVSALDPSAGCGPGPLPGRDTAGEAAAPPPDRALPASAGSPPPVAPAAAETDKLSFDRRTEQKVAGSVRVPAERLDELMDRVGELVIAQARLTQLAHARNDSVVSAIAEEVERLASGLRDTTMGIRMVPIGSLFARFRRLIHDLSRDLGKPVEFITAGEDTELDKTMIERLADPLVHLIRNAIDHGIEKPDRRRAAGKPEVGRIELLAQHTGAQVMITVRDDGAGLDAARIRAKAEEQGLVAPGAALTEGETYDLLFHPGFSTAETVSALSGRGVGMDVVKRTIEAIRGSIDLSTTPGAGSTVSLRLPLTLAIIEGLLIRVGDARYIIPLSVIEECVELPVPGAGSRGVEGRSFLNMRGGLVPFLRLRDLFGASGEPDQHQKVIVTSVGDARVGLVADQIIGSHQTVIKSLSKLHVDVTMFSGATILGDGTAALILDVAQLVSLAQAKADAELMTRAA